MLSFAISTPLVPFSLFDCLSVLTFGLVQLLVIVNVATDVMTASVRDFVSC